MQKKKGKKNNRHGKGRKDVAEKAAEADEGGLSDDQKPVAATDEGAENCEDAHNAGHHHGGCCGHHDHNGQEPSSAVPAPPRELVTTFVQSERCGIRHDLQGLPSKYIVYEQYKSEEQLPRIMEMMTADLSEPYSIFTYRYFINNWPDLCFLAVLHDEADPTEKRVIGSIVCKLDYHKGHSNPQRCIRGYIAMLVVEKQFRKHGLGSTLAHYAIETMTLKNCDEVVLETEVTNSGALRLYENLGFVRDKRLQRYYLNGVDAFRLKLWLTPFLL